MTEQDKYCLEPHRTESYREAWYPTPWKKKTQKTLHKLDEQKKIPVFIQTNPTHIMMGTIVH